MITSAAYRPIPLAYCHRLKISLPIKIISPSSELIMRAAEIKAKYAISYADCFASATAKKLSAAIITGDAEFKKVKHFVSVDWI